MLSVAFLILGLTVGNWIGLTAERGWWKRNLLDQDDQAPGIRKRLGLD